MYRPPANDLFNENNITSFTTATIRNVPPTSFDHKLKQFKQIIF